MRLKYNRFEELVSQNKQELMEDDKLMKRLEIQLEKKQTEEPKKHVAHQRRIFQ